MSNGVAAAAATAPFRCGILPPRTLRRYLARLDRVPLAKLAWPLGGPPGDGCIGDLSSADHVILTTTSRSMLALRWNVKCHVSALIFEPSTIQGRWYRLLRLIGPTCFHRVFTHHPGLAAAIANGRLVPHGGATISERADEPPPKRGLVSIIASRHASMPGHRLRHRIVAWSRTHRPDLEAFGTGYRPVDDKWEGHAPFHYSVVIENSRCPGYFTEKLLDSFLAWSLPIYWGDPEIERVFLPEGMLVCETEDQIQERLASLSAEEFERRLPALAENQRRARALAPGMGTHAATLLEQESHG
jgi:hypothetical protein